MVPGSFGSPDRGICWTKRPRTGSGDVNRQPVLFTRPFVLICLATLFFYLSFYLILPVMPLYVAGLGGSSTQIGLIIGLFAFASMLLKPPSGWIIDRRGNRPVLLIGMAVFLLASLGYMLIRSITGILALRVFHGIGMGLFPTAATVVVAELAPISRRGEAMGWFGVANSVGMILGPAAGTAVAAHLGYPALFLLAAGIAGAGLGCLVMLPSVGPPATDLSWTFRWRDLFSRAAILPAALLLFLFVPYGSMMAFIPIVAARRGVGNPGTFYSVFALAVLAVRAKAGRISDVMGRAAVILPGMAVGAAAFAILGLSGGPLGVLVGAAVYGIAFGSVQPALMALTADRVPAAERGKAMGTFYTAWELGVSLGGTGSGLLLRIGDFSFMLLACAAFPAAGALLSLRAKSPAAICPPSQAGRSSETAAEPTE
jgi:MFS family permease